MRDGEGSPPGAPHLRPSLTSNVTWRGSFTVHLDSPRHSIWHHSGGELEVVCLLLERGADLDAEDNSGRTAFQAFQVALALGSGYHNIAKLLSET
jgi:hypothetical protein